MQEIFGEIRDFAGEMSRIKAHGGNYLPGNELPDYRFKLPGISLVY